MCLYLCVYVYVYMFLCIYVFVSMKICGLQESWYVFVYVFVYVFYDTFQREIRRHTHSSNNRLKHRKCHEWLRKLSYVQFKHRGNSVGTFALQIKCFWRIELILDTKKKRYFDIKTVVLLNTFSSFAAHLDVVDLFNISWHAKQSFLLKCFIL